MAQDMKVRVAAANDVERICLLVNSAYRGDSSRVGWTTEADLLDGQRTDPAALRQLVAQDDAVILLLLDGPSEALLGCVELRNKRGSAYLGMLTIEPGLQGKGLGRALMSAAETWAREQWTSETIEMTVIAQRAELIAYYERRGYSRTGRREPFPYGDPRFGLPKVGDLEFTVLEKRL